jgi:hypothetical protein
MYSNNMYMKGITKAMVENEGAKTMSRHRRHGMTEPGASAGWSRVCCGLLLMGHAAHNSCLFEGARTLSERILHSRNVTLCTCVRQVKIQGIKKKTKSTVIILRGSAILLFVVKGSNERIDVVLGVTCCRDVTITIRTLKELQALKDVSIKTILKFGACKTATGECALGGCS